jgi:hypothetical protein
MNRTGDSWRLDWSDPLEDGGQLFNYRAFYTVEEYRDWARQNPNLA